MLSRNLIFSEKKRYRIKRHFLFWVVALFYIEITDLRWLLNIDLFLASTLSNIFILLPAVFFVYPLLYFVLPRFCLKRKYAEAFFLTIGLVLVCAFARSTITQYITNSLISYVVPNGVYFSYSFSYSYTGSLIFVLLTVTFFAPMAIAVKFIKQWYLKEKRHLELQKESSEAQLQLLAAQIHPHFLFNTLNNIYSRAQVESPGSAKMIMGLSHILRFVLDEGNQALVPVESELQMLTDYINLEKVSSDDRLDLHVSMPSDTENIYIAPLLILPFVENSFKHGSSKMLQRPWMSLKIEVKNNLFSMKLMNGKRPFSDHFNSPKGNGIENVKKRLDLLYKNKYILQINEDQEVFVVNLVMELVSIDKPSSLRDLLVTAYG